MGYEYSLHRERAEGDVSVVILRSEADAIAQQTQGAIICRRTVGEWEDYETADEAAQYLNEHAWRTQPVPAPCSGQTSRS